MTARSLPAPGSLPERTPAAPRRIVTWLRLCMARRRQRQALAELDDRLLADIGVSRGAAARECAKPFWR